MNPVKHMKLCIMIVCLLFTCHSVPAENPRGFTDISELVSYLYRLPDMHVLDDLENYIDEADKDKTVEISLMIKKSNLPQTYEQHLEKIDETSYRLNYHQLDKDLNFQVDIEKIEDKYFIKRIWLSR
jgi:hypothetical protein